MDTRQLRHFLAVAETLHFGRAAERLGMTQPPLSQSIQALERELGSALFQRTRRSVALTPFGAQWLKPARAALEGMEALPQVARRLLDGETGVLELSFVSTADYSVLPDLVRRYTAQFPGVRMVLSEVTSDLSIAALLAGRGHAGLVIPPSGGGLPDGLEYRTLVSETLVAAVPESWVAEGRVQLSQGRLSAATVVDAPLIIFPQHTAPAFHQLVMDYFTAHGGVARIAQEAIQMQTIIALVSAGLGLALVPASMRHLARTGVRYVELREDAPLLTTGVVWRRNDSTPTLRRFLEVVATLA